VLDCARAIFGLKMPCVRNLLLPDDANPAAIAAAEPFKKERREMPICFFAMMKIL
jgi:hypothetical protein